MPLVLQAVPLALRTLPHCVLVLPFIAVMVLLLSLLALIPVVGLIVPGTISAFCAIIGFRCALAARGYGNEPALGAIVGASLLFSVINALAGLVVLALILGVTMLQVGLPDDLAGLVDMLGYLEAQSGWLAVLQVVLVAVYFSAMAVPMTATAVAATPGGRRPDPFQGLGAGFANVAIVLGITAAASEVLRLFDALWLAVAQMALWLFMYVFGQELPDLPVFDLALAGSVTALIFASCWYFATAVLAWEATQQRQRDPLGRPAPAPRASAEDLRALRASRMPGDHNPPGDY